MQFTGFLKRKIKAKKSRAGKWAKYFNIAISVFALFVAFYYYNKNYDLSDKVFSFSKKQAEHNDTVTADQRKVTDSTVKALQGLHEVNRQVLELQKHNSLTEYNRWVLLNGPVLSVGGFNFTTRRVLSRHQFDSIRWEYDPFVKYAVNSDSVYVCNYLAAYDSLTHRDLVDDPRIVNYGELFNRIRKSGPHNYRKIEFLKVFRFTIMLNNSGNIMARNVRCDFSYSLDSARTWTRHKAQTKVDVVKGMPSDMDELIYMPVDQPFPEILYVRFYFSFQSAVDKNVSSLIKGYYDSRTNEWKNDD